MDQDDEQGEPEEQTCAAPPQGRGGGGCPRNVKITLMVLLLFFVGEYILLPELASARQEFHQLSHLNFLWLILGALLEVAALLAYAELTHTVLSPGAPDRFRIFRINMWALAISHVLPGGTGAGHRRQLPAADRGRTCRAAPPPSGWPPRASARPSCSTSSSGWPC